MLSKHPKTSKCISSTDDIRPSQNYKLRFAIHNRSTLKLVRPQTILGEIKIYPSPLPFSQSTVLSLSGPCQNVTHLAAVYRKDFTEMAPRLFFLRTPRNTTTTPIYHCRKKDGGENVCCFSVRQAVGSCKGASTLIPEIMRILKEKRRTRHDSVVFRRRPTLARRSLRQVF
jgi:hypothetical protein